MYGPKKKTTINNFVEYLDSLKNHYEIDYCSMANMMYLSHLHYYENCMFDSYFSGKIKSPKNKQLCLNNPSNFDNWKREHEQTTLSVSPDIMNIKEPKREMEKKHVEIDVSINNLDDIIQLIKNNPYASDIEYNIDLKSLTNIQSELEQLNSMIGMKSLKSSILDQLVYFIQDLHLSNGTSDFKHTVLFGPPGTGKTEVAKIIGTMYSKLGILKKNTFKKVTRNDLVAGYLGQTAIKTKAVIQECLGGVLFIDEAYSLANSYNEDSFSKECIDTLCEALSDHKNDLMVIIAGYENELNNTFFKANPGLESRFMWRFNTDSYTASELKCIFKKKVEDAGWKLGEKVLSDSWIEKRKDNFASFGRDMEMLFSYTKISHARRVYGKPKEERKQINIEDLDKGYTMLLANRKQEPKLSKAIYSMYV